MEHIKNTLGCLKLGPAQSYRNLSIFPLFAQRSEPFEYVLLDDALEKQAARVAEVSEGGSVPELRFENNGDKCVLLVDGEELLGARQNRVLNLTILVPAFTHLAIPVSCVERGRWSYVSRNFRSAKRTLFAKARASKIVQVSASLRRSGTRVSDQSAVWGHIADKFERLNAASRTEAMGDLYAQHESRLADFHGAFEAKSSQVGAVFAVNGVPVGAEFFDCAPTFHRFLRKLLDSYALDAIEIDRLDTDVPSIEEAAEFLRRVQAASFESFKALGEGQDVRLHGSGVAGAALVKDQRVIHLAAFADVGA
jgi:hypothetical protein